MSQTGSKGVGATRSTFQPYQLHQFDRSMIAAEAIEIRSTESLASCGLLAARINCNRSRLCSEEEFLGPNFPSATNKPFLLS